MSVFQAFSRSPCLKVTYGLCAKCATTIDPTCSSGSFLTEIYISLRRLENKVLEILQRGQIVLGGLGDYNPIQVSIGQFYGIEINDFAVTVVKTALWIAESQMRKETEDVVHMNLDFLPLKPMQTINCYLIDGDNILVRSRNPLYVKYLR